MAPTNAPANTEKKPDRLNVPADMLPPKNNITNATPKLAPELMPKIDGPANGFKTLSATSTRKQPMRFRKAMPSKLGVSGTPIR